MNSQRVRLLQNGASKKGPVLYWMSRDQRVQNNWAILFAQQLAEENNVPLIVVFSLVSDFLFATQRHFGFLLKGLQQAEQDLLHFNIPFVLLYGEPAEQIPVFIAENNISILVSDFDPLKIKRIWKKHLAPKITIPFYEVDAHNIVPALHISRKMEYSAYTLRLKMQKMLPDFLDPFPGITPQKKSVSLRLQTNDWHYACNLLPVDTFVKEVPHIIPGEHAAQEQLEHFMEHTLSGYNEKRNDPNGDAQSNLSPYLHFGQISAQHIAKEVQKRFLPDTNTEAFLEEMIVRRELADNYCYYNTKYDSVEGFYPWARTTLQIHSKDKREYIYSTEEFEAASTHDDLWNACQLEMKYTGKMHGYLRMYWAKKILEWTETPEQALQTAIYLNDRYELDGRDPNGYAGCAWSIGGIHDRAWGERPIFGKIRYMNYNGCARKFNIAEYVTRVHSLNTNV